MHIKTQIILNDSAANVWKKLIDFSKYPAWNQLITRIEGKLKVGDSLVITLQLPNKKPHTFKPIVKKVIPEAEFCWVGKILFNWIFTGEHYLRLSSSSQRTVVSHGEKFSGLLAPIIMYFMRNVIEDGFNLMNKNLENMILQDNIVNLNLPQKSLTQLIVDKKINSMPLVKIYHPQNVYCAKPSGCEEIID